MRDTENTLPSSKKRAASRELSRDNSGLDDEEEIPGQESDTFNRASDEVLANGSIKKVCGDGTGLLGTGRWSSTFSFGRNSSSFGTPSGTSDKPSGIKTSTMQEVPMKTGEENDEVVFTADSVLFEFLEGRWKECGKGELKVNKLSNVLTTGKKKGRLVMRERGNYRLILNARILPEMELTNMEKKGITFICWNSAGGGQSRFSRFALKFNDAGTVNKFRSVVTEHMGNNVAPMVLET